MTDQAEKKHSAFWGVMVIAGTVIGGGMFALPVDLAGAWFFWGAFILIIAWFSMLHSGNDSNLLIVFYVQIMPDDFVMQLHRF